MKMLAFTFLALLVTGQAVALRAQTPDKPQPKFSLTLSFFYPFGAGLPGQPTFRELQVDETNLSNELLPERPCLEFTGVFRITVTRDGSPQPERDEALRRRREAYAKLRSCRQMYSPGIPPGGVWKLYLRSFGRDYPLDLPGTYAITVSRESDPEHPEKSVTVTSNTITVTVSEEEAKANKPEPELDEPIVLTAPFPKVHVGDPIVVFLTQNELTSQSANKKLVDQRITYDVFEWADLEITMDGAPVPATQRLQEHIDSLKGYVPLHKPGVGLEFEGKIPLGDYYDMSKPGEYQVVATMKCTQCGSEPIVKSNTITITVVPRGTRIYDHGLLISK
jgi:hypothetical protein